MTPEPVDHCTYIIRAWKEPASSPEAGQWRFVLITVDSKQREGFVVIEHLLKALQSELTNVTQDLPP
ncbi:MAG: hypothetical protein R3C14_23385 [Caldilineaceae bacterium]